MQTKQSREPLTQPMLTELPDEMESVLWQGVNSSRSLIGGWIGAVIISALILAAITRIEVLQDNRMVRFVAMIFVVIMWLGLLGLATVRKLRLHFQLTNQRLTYLGGIFIKRLHCIDLNDVEDVSYRQGPLQALLNVGTVKIESSDPSKSELTIPGVANVRQVVELIDGARRAERLRRLKS